MKKMLITAGLAVLCHAAFAQSYKDDPNGVVPDTTVKQTEPEKIFKTIEQVPEFPGGLSALQRYLADNIRYPADAMKNNVTGKVVVRFVVCQDGSLCNEQVVRSVGGGCDEEVIRVIKAMPQWKPGMQDGKKVKVYYTLPVTFSLEDDKPKNEEQ